VPTRKAHYCDPVVGIVFLWFFWGQSPLSHSAFVHSEGKWERLQIGGRLQGELSLSEQELIQRHKIASLKIHLNRRGLFASNDMGARTVF
jgi:hypothetical protein